MICGSRLIIRESWAIGKHNEEHVCQLEVGHDGLHRSNACYQWDADNERLAALEGSATEAAAWLERRPDMTEGDAATSTRLRDALAVRGQEVGE